MRREGNRNFGVWNPPTGMDSVRRSVQVDFELIVRSNNPKIGKELGTQQSFGKELVQSRDLDIPLLVSLNNNSLNIFSGMRQQGWK